MFGSFVKFIKFKKNGWKSNYFRKSFILLLLITFIPGLISGVGIYWFGVSKVESELKELHQSQISQRANTINDQFDYLEMSLSHWAFEPRFNTSLVDLNFVSEFKETRDIVKMLLVLQGSHPLIHKVELFVESNNPILFKPHYNVIQDEEEHQFYLSILESGHHISWEQLYNTPTDGTFDDPTPLVLTHSVPGVSTYPYGSLIVTLDRSKVANLLGTLTPYNEGATLLLNEDNRVIVGTNSTKHSAFTAELRNKVLDQEEEEGSFSFKFEGATYSVSFGKMERIGTEWTYVSAAPMSSITSPIVFISKIIVIISLTGLFIAFIMSWFASKKIYRPVAKLVSLLDSDGQGKFQTQPNKDEFTLIEQQFYALSTESKTLQKRLSTQVPQLKNSFLLQLIQGYLYHYSEETLRERMSSYGWKLQDQSFIVVDIQVTGFSEVDDSFVQNDESLTSFAVTNMIEELAQERFEQFNVLNFHDLSIGMLIVFPYTSDLTTELNEFSSHLMDVLNRLIQMNVTVTISEPTVQVKRIPHLFKEVRLGKRYRNFENKNQIINLQEMKRSSNHNQISYPFDIEKEIIQSIRMGQVVETERLIRDFIKDLTDNCMKEISIQPGIIQLFSRIQHEILHSGIHPYELFNERNMFEELAYIREPEQVVKWITNEVVIPFVQMLEGRVNIEMKQLVERVCSYIQIKYMEDISLESCAEEVNTNPYTLSKAFKKIIGINFIDYLTTLRIDQAKDLLLNTNMKISDISEKVGYRHSYFNRIFKKQVGVPPSQFRKIQTNDQT